MYELRRAIGGYSLSAISLNIIWRHRVRAAHELPLPYRCNLTRPHPYTVHKAKQNLLFRRAALFAHLNRRPKRRSTSSVNSSR